MGNEEMSAIYKRKVEQNGCKYFEYESEFIMP